MSKIVFYISLSPLKINEQIKTHHLNLHDHFGISNNFQTTKKRLFLLTLKSSQKTMPRRSYKILKKTTNITTNKH